MSLSCTEPDLITVRPGQSGLAAQLPKLMSAPKAIFHEAFLSPHVASVLLRVVSSMALGFALVRLVKLYTA